MTTQPAGEGDGPGPGTDLDDLVARLGLAPVGRDGGTGGPACPVLEFAASGAMWLTGPGGGPPVAVTSPVLPWARRVCAVIGALSDRRGRRVEIDAARALTERAAARGFERRGDRSANGSCRLVRADDGWAAVNLSRPSDVELLPAVIGEFRGDPADAVAAVARRTSAQELVDRARLVGIPAAALPAPPGAPGTDAAWRVLDLGAAGTEPAARRPVVVDFSAMWAGPLCASVLGRAGARVIKVEDPDRPDAARRGDPALFETLHAGHDLAPVRFADPGDRRRVLELVEGADVVIEASRPRALTQVGLEPDRFLRQRPGRTWISITGYGRRGEGANWVAFGDDAAVAGGLVGWAPDGSPVFCADAVADPLSGLLAAGAGLASMAAGGGHLVEISMAGTSAAVASAPGCPQGHGVVRDEAGSWFVTHAACRQAVLPPVWAELSGGQ